MQEERQKRTFENEDGGIIAVREIVIVNMLPHQSPYSNQVGVVIDTEYTWSPSDGPVAVQFLADEPLLRSDCPWPKDFFERIYFTKPRFVAFYPHELKRHPQPWSIDQRLIKAALSQKN